MAQAEKKAYFISELEVKLAKGDGICEPAAPLAYWSPLVGRIQVPAGFQTDFASVPRLPIAYWLYGARAHREGVNQRSVFLSARCLDDRDGVFVLVVAAVADAVVQALFEKISHSGANLP